MVIQPVVTASRNIVVLGDSYASGNGARSSDWTLGSTNPSASYNYEGVENCFRSPTSWASQLAAALGATSYVNRACSSGVIQDIVTNPRSMGNVAKVAGACPTSPNSPEEYYVDNGGSTCTRYLETQINGVDSSTDIVIVGIGGNDLAFEEMVKDCFVPNFRSESKCSNQMSFASNQLPAFTSDLTSALLDIEAKLNDDAQVWVVAYPHIVKTDNPPYRCCWWSGDNLDVTTPMRALGIAFDTATQAAIDDANAAASRGNFAFFFDDTKTLFNGHEPDPDSTNSNPDRWVFELFNLELAEWWHLNPIGHGELSSALATHLSPLIPPNVDNPTDSPIPSGAPTLPPIPPSSPPTSPPVTPTSQPVDAPAPTPTTVNPPAPSPQPGCFSSFNTVEVEGKGFVSMDSLRIGDSVRSNKDSFSTVYGFLHLDRKVQATFYRIQVGHGSTLELTGSHLVHIYDTSAQHAVQAADVKVGDILQTTRGSHNASVVHGVKVVHRQGLFAPLTYSGTIVVGGIVASNYVAVLDNQLGLSSSSQDVLIHAFFALRRMACSWDFARCADEKYATTGISAFAANAAAYLDLVVSQETSVFLQAGALAWGLPALMAEQLVSALRFVPLSGLVSLMVATVLLLRLKPHKSRADRKSCRSIGVAQQGMKTHWRENFRWQVRLCRQGSCQLDCWEHPMAEKLDPQGL